MTLLTNNASQSIYNDSRGVICQEKPKEYEWQIIWRNVITILYLHVTSIYAFYLLFSGAVKLQTVIFSISLMVGTVLGMTAGAHRLWSHRAYKARWPLRLFLAIMQTISFQGHIYEWTRDHRAHHKFTETDADPHNSRRGFFFSHVGWVMLRRHKDLIEKALTIDMSDLQKDPIVMFQKKTYPVIMPLLCFIIPAWIPVTYWNENAWHSWNVAAIWRYTISLHITFLLNSVGHMWGDRPYDKNIFATDMKALAIITGGEGWHNYHHVFPWDYKSGELGNYSTNFSTGFIDLAAKLGLAYDLKTVPREIIKSRAARTGDGTHLTANIKNVDDNNILHLKNPTWGWDDKDMTEEDRNFCEISHKTD